VLLIVLWVRSYQQADDVTCGLSSGPGYRCISLNGELLACRYPSREGAVSLGWVIRHLPGHDPHAFPSSWPSTLHGIAFEFSEGRLWLTVLPQWFIAALFATLATVPWIRHSKWRFTLRTLLIATTLVAVVLGAIVYAVR
jgi:hypothetical protein